MASHPLEPLSADEFQQTAEILRRERGITDAYRFASIELQEPTKATVKSWSPGEPVPRTSFAVLWDRSDGMTYEAVVDLTGNTVESWTAVPNVVSNFTVDEWHECDEAMRADPQVKEALARRGVTDLDLVLFDVWTYGKALMPHQYRDRRLGWCDVWYRSVPGGNPYAHLMAGLKLIVDMNTMQLLDIDDNGSIDEAACDGRVHPGPDPGADGCVTISPRCTSLNRTVSRSPSTTVSCDGSDGRCAWGSTTARVRSSTRCSTTIRTGGAVSLYRMSFAEMVVPYRDPTFDHYRRTAYDIGEWGLGFMTTSLELGCDCLGEIRYVDAVLPDTTASPTRS